jgi:hypothetical protein
MSRAKFLPEGKTPAWPLNSVSRVYLMDEQVH